MERERGPLGGPSPLRTVENRPEPSLRLLLASLDDVVWTATPAGDEKLTVSDSCQKVYGRPAEEFIQNPNLWLETVHPDDRAIAEASAQHLRELGAWVAVYRIVRPDGTVRWISDHKCVIQDDRGTELFIGGVARDVTGWYRVTQLIEVQQALLGEISAGGDLRSALDSLCRGIDQLVPNAAASVVLFDENRDHLHLAAAPGLPQELLDRYDSLEPGPYAGSCGTAVHTGEAVFVVDTRTDPRWARFRDLVEDFGIRSSWSVPIHDAQGQVMGALGIASFVERYPAQSDRQILEIAARSASLALSACQERRALVNEKDSAEQDTRKISGFLAGVSHELRTPMTAIIGFAEELLEDPAVRALPTARFEDLRTIQRNGKHLLQLINNLLDISKIESGKLDVERIACSPQQLVAETAASLKAAAAEKQLSLEVEYDLPIPQQILSDPTRIRQILFNLIGNAVKFTSQGGVRVRVGCRAEGETAQLRIDVIDTGIGLSKEQIARVFQPFVQADSSTTRRFGGTGLGLSLCRQLAELLGGEISVVSVPRQGSTFTLRLTAPIHREETTVPDRPVESAGMRVESPPSKNSTLPRLSGRFLVVEDSPDNRRLIEVMLTKAGATVVTAENGVEACEIAAQAEIGRPAFAAILMDMQMPNMDGYTATRQLRAGGYDGPIIALTAHAMAGDRQRCLNAGCDSFVSKPIHRADLLSLLASLP